MRKLLGLTLVALLFVGVIGGLIRLYRLQTNDCPTDDALDPGTSNRAELPKNSANIAPAQACLVQDCYLAQGCCLA